jgi:hypothetical protein
MIEGRDRDAAEFLGGFLAAKRSTKADKFTR